MKSQNDINHDIRHTQVSIDFIKLIEFSTLRRFDFIVIPNLLSIDRGELATKVLAILMFMS